MIQRGPDYEEMAAARIHNCVEAERDRLLIRDQLDAMAARIAALEEAGRELAYYVDIAGQTDSDEALHEALWAWQRLVPDGGPRGEG
jgi:hypothetical protein